MTKAFMTLPSVGGRIPDVCDYFLLLLTRPPQVSPGKVSGHVGTATYPRRLPVRITLGGGLCYHLSRNGDLDLDTGLDVDDDLLDDFGGCVQATVRAT